MAVGMHRWKKFAIYYAHVYSSLVFFRLTYGKRRQVTWWLYYNSLVFFRLTYGKRCRQVVNYCGCGNKLHQHTRLEQIKVTAAFDRLMAEQSVCGL